MPDLGNHGNFDGVARDQGGGNRGLGVEFGTNFRIDTELLEALREIRQRDGLPIAEQVRRAIRARVESIRRQKETQFLRPEQSRSPHYVRQFGHGTDEEVAIAIPRQWRPIFIGLMEVLVVGSQKVRRHPESWRLGVFRTSPYKCMAEGEGAGDGALGAGGVNMSASIRIFSFGRYAMTMPST
jgi:hypothetical protein